MGGDQPSSKSDSREPPVKQKRSKQKLRKSGQKYKRTCSEEGAQQGENRRDESSHNFREGTNTGGGMVSLMFFTAVIALTVL